RAVDQFHRSIVQDRPELDVQPDVAVDQIVAALAFEDIAASAAEQDVAADKWSRYTCGDEWFSERRHQSGEAGDFLRRPRLVPQLHARQELQLERRRRVEDEVVAADVIVEVPTRRAVDETVLVAQVVEVERNARQREEIQLDVGRERPRPLRDPVEAEIAEELVAAFGHQEDVVAAFAEMVVLAETAIHDIFSAYRAQSREHIEVVAAVAEQPSVT